MVDRVRELERRVRWRWELTGAVWTVVPCGLAVDGATLALTGGRVATSFEPAGLFDTQADAVSAGAPPLPTDVSGLTQWLPSCLSAVSLTGDLVDTWIDQSGSGNDATASGASRATWVSGDPASSSDPSRAQIGAPVLTFAGSQFFTGPLFSALLTADVGTIFCLVRGNLPSVPVSEAADRLLLRITPNTVSENNDGTVDQAFTDGYTGDTWALLQWRHGSSTLFHQRDDLTEASVSSGSTVALGAQSIGRAGSGTFALTGAIADIAVYDHELSGPDIATVKAYYTALSGIPS